LTVTLADGAQKSFFSSSSVIDFGGGAAGLSAGAACRGAVESHPSSPFTDEPVESLDDSDPAESVLYLRGEES